MGNNKELSELQMSRLMDAALTARKSAYAPYSGFRVGAALMFDNDEFVAGCNVENASYGLSICAERNAMAAAVANGLVSPVAIAIAGKDGKPCPPCGACRQVLAEFNPDIKVIMQHDGSFFVRSLRELLPMQFSMKQEGDNKNECKG